LIVVVGAFSTSLTGVMMDVYATGLMLIGLMFSITATGLIIAIWAARHNKRKPTPLGAADVVEVSQAKKQRSEHIKAADLKTLIF